MPAEAPVRIVVLGGGTAGWMAANLFAKRWNGAAGGRRAVVTVIESPDIGIIGVGEGSTPQLKAFFDDLGLAERDWMPRCNATYKVGIAFHGWSARPGYESYFHPFPTGVDDQSADAFFTNCAARRGGFALEAHPDKFFLPAALAREKRAPTGIIGTGLEVSYGYHFDAHLVGAVLRDHAVAQGVRHLPLNVTRVDVSKTGDVAALVTEDGQHITADIFVDSSGFRGVIAQQALGEPFLPFAENLFNDSAVVMPTPADPKCLNVHTKSTAMSAGWCWDIPLTSRTGNGYVYSSRYLDADAAETELRQHLGMLDSDVAVRHLTMKVGRLARSWTGNCLAVGLSQGFIEPLEATALHIVQATVEGFIDAYDRGGFTPQHRDAFNQMIAARYEGIRDYIVCHYRVNQRRDSDYWRDNAANTALSPSLKSLLTTWFSGGDLVAEVQRQNIGRYYSAISWHCLLAGYGSFPDDNRLRAAVAGMDIALLARMLTGRAKDFPRHGDALRAMMTTSTAQ